MWNGCALRRAQENAGPPDRSCHHRSVDRKVQREQRLCWVGSCWMWVGDRLALSAPPSLVPEPLKDREQERVGVQGLALCLAGERPPS